MRSACTFSAYVAFVGLGVFWATLSGCASEGDALEKRFAKLQEEITRLQTISDAAANREQMSLLPDLLDNERD